MSNKIPLIPIGSKVNVLSLEQYLEIKTKNHLTFEGGIRLSIPNNLTITDVFKIIDGKKLKIVSSDASVYNSYSLQLPNDNGVIGCDENFIRITQQAKQKLIDTEIKVISDEFDSLLDLLRTKFVYIAYNLVTGGTNEQLSFKTENFKVERLGDKLGIRLETLTLFKADIIKLLDNGKLADFEKSMTRHTTFRYSNIFGYTKDELKHIPKDSKVEWN